MSASRALIGRRIVSSAPNQSGCFRPDYVTPDRQLAQDRTFGLAPVAAVHWHVFTSRKRTSTRRGRWVWIGMLTDARLKPPEGPLVS
jgi:hypothetical protein